MSCKSYVLYQAILLRSKPSYTECLGGEMGRSQHEADQIMVQMGTQGISRALQTEHTAVRLINIAPYIG